MKGGGGANRHTLLVARKSSFASPPAKLLLSQMGGNEESAVLLMLVAALVAVLPLHCRGQNAPSADAWKGLDATIEENKAVTSRIVQAMRNLAHLHQTVGCIPEVQEPQKVVLKKTDLYAQEMAVLITTLYRELRWFKDATQGTCPTQCQKSEWRCKSGQCIPLYYRCDGLANCSDGSDETPLCMSGCGPDKFRCAADNTCLPLWRRCDGVFHCTNGADEQCQDSCSPNEFLCQHDRRCLPASWTCDGDPDCSDGADERFCFDIEEDETTTTTTTSTTTTTTPTTPFAQEHVCRPGEFRCATGDMCVSLDLLCNGMGNCFDASDEDETLCPQTTTPQSTCPLNTFRCVSSSRCIVSWWRCDGYPECEDASDEQDCIYGLQCGRDKIFCLSDRTCLEASQRCDGVMDCSDNTDEMDCPTTTPDITTPPTITPLTTTPSTTTPSTTPTSTTETSTTPSSTFLSCQPDEFQCSSEEMCIPQDMLCDGIADCFDSSDEEDCTTTATTTTTPQGTRVTGDLRLGQGSTTTALVRITIDDNTTSATPTTTEPMITTTTTTTTTVVTPSAATAPAVATEQPQVTASCPSRYLPCTSESCVHERLACLNTARIVCVNMSREVMDMCQECRRAGISERTCLQNSQTAVSQTAVQYNGR
ncbi:sortilin-related receptor-like isoform X2 [Portunus trituberculatus]|uniref:sortilin-related receptor-like isoform X2 n=1 Tax=Portunus trituberculatus TaxID=210409 RepID=UPI001E1CC199|nr:sortilin-related receptor-like isoform X2 [Portunus trituberculatus]